VLFTPAFLFLFPAIDPAFPHLTPNQAVAMGIIVEFVGYTSASSGYCYRRMVAFDMARPLLLISVPTAVALSFVAYAVPPRWLLLAFGAILFLLAALVVWGRRAPAAGALAAQAPTADPPGVLRRHVSREGRVFSYRFRAGWRERAVSAAAGAFGGLAGIGMGPIVTALLHIRHRVPIHLATATSIFVVAVTVLSAAVSQGILAARRGGGLPWTLLAPVVVAVLVGGQIAPRLARRVPRA
jgi:uncharacterized protein